jgi:phosphoribosyl-ATP pyrophosphohydrolase/phosphoribosyl-AMP cyclohydrolase
MIDFSSLTPGSDGLVTAIVQDTGSRSVLMVAFMNAEALAATQETGYAHFWSRSRNELWRKGATSGNTLAVTSIRVDCDRDALLVEATPSGPACHTGAQTCFGPAPDSLGATIDDLAASVASRSTADPESSYTARLVLDRDLAARKVLEEAGETAFAVKDLDAGAPAQRVVEESADLIYHLLALLGASGIDTGDVARELRSRMVDRPST